MPPFLVESSLARGYSVRNLVEAGVPVDNMLAGGASYGDLNDAGVLVSDLLNQGYTPIELFEGDVLLDSLYGQIYQGGYIFYLDTLDIHPFQGLLAALSDQPFKRWSGSHTLINVTGFAIGTGQSNTTAIITDQYPPGNFAAYLCDTITINGYNDWFLPSQDELNLMWENLADSDGDGSNSGPSDPGNIGGFEIAGGSIDGYWSSTEGNSTGAWLQSFNDGNQFGRDKLTNQRVRAVRAF
jgi:hypothetical protein